ncbi:YeiH family protein [Paenibacillus lentus]|uniref:YeiH family putative sulfate export transporter n=1 Tax=Paenibacillus lentus TaxID=1338368 RepID=A0A3S8S166_9BACL|nr:YeiH family protein [Paenibacillus lentus]AZK48877.1 YeiH family putative sulfate export transporter [Paenibacillus lentus]
MAQTVQSQTQTVPFKRRRGPGFVHGVGLTVLLAIAAKYLSSLPLLSVMGHLVIAIMLGLVWRAVIGVPEYAAGGISFSSKKLLRFGIILLGMRLNLQSIVQAGPKMFTMAIIHITFTIAVVWGLAKWLKIPGKLGILTACGTAICGAAAVVAIAPQIKAKDEETAIGAAVVAMLGTLFTLIYSLIYPVIGLSAQGYGVLSGATLHEIAHVIAAAAPAGNEAEDIAVVAKLTRVAMLVPVSLLLGMWMNRKERRENEAVGQTEVEVSRQCSIQIPWFILGFLLMSGVNTLGIISERASGIIVAVAYMLIAVAMAGLGLGVDVAVFRRLGIRPFWAGLIGSIALSVLGYGSLYLLNLN